MKKPPIISKLKEPVVRNTIIVFSVVTVGLLLYWGFLNVAFSGNPFATNRAKEIAAPIEKSLEQAGAVKVCDEGATGYEATNRVPWYDARYQLNVGKDQAIEIVKKAAQDNGYVLERDDDPSYYYYDSILNFGAQKPSPYPDLVEGRIGVGVSLYVNTDKSKLSCDKGVYLVGDNTHTAFSLGVSLPEYKR